MLRFVVDAVLVMLLTLVTQIGGLAWLISRFFKRSKLAFCGLYLLMSVSASLIAPLFGRVALSCGGDGPLKVQSWAYCAANRNYVTPEMADVLHDAAAAMDERFPDVQVVVLDANFPFLDGFPLPPHLSHDDGEKADLAFFYRDETGYLPGKTRSPIGYFAFEQGPTDCPSQARSMRWDLDFLQPFWTDDQLEPDRMREILRILSKDDRVGKIFIEPHLVTQLGVSHPKIRFQGCRAARHDDHIHLQL